MGPHSIPSNTGGYIACTWVAYENQALPHSIPGNTGGYITCRWVAYENQALYLFFFIGDSDEKSKKGTKRKKPPPAAIENDFLPKRRSARVRNGKCLRLHNSFIIEPYHTNTPSTGPSFSGLNKSSITGPHIDFLHVDVLI